MKNIKYLITSFIFFVLLTSCGVIKDGFSLQKKDNDGFATHLITIIENNFSLKFSTELVKNKEWIQFPIINDKEICVINIPKGSEPQYLIRSDKNGNKSKVFFIRLDAQTKPIQNENEKEKYIIQNFPNFEK